MNLQEAIDSQENDLDVNPEEAIVSQKKDSDHCVDPEEAIVSQEVLQHDSSRIVELHYQHNKSVEERVQAWKDHLQSDLIHSDVNVFTMCEGYWDLLKMEPSIIAHLMVEYYHDQGGFWFELLHEIIHGRKMGAHMVQKRPLFEAWCRFFNKGEHDQAFKYIPTALDRSIFNAGEISPSL